MYSVNADEVNEADPKNSVFRETEKLYRIPPEPSKRERKKPGIKKETDFSNVIDFENIANNTPENRELIVPVELKVGVNSPFANVENLRAYTLSNIPGLYFIPNPFSPQQQKYWIKRCLKDFTVGNQTNVSNLSRLSYAEQNPEVKEEDIPDFLWTEYNPQFKEQLRWATLGYHFQWTPRKYLDEYKGEFPDDLRDLCRELAKLLNYDMVPEAATLNFYPISKQSMSAHLDDAEDDMSKPIVSVSFGNTVVFLIGGRTRKVKPTALFIRSGDVVLMGGESRYCYHGVPRMLQSTAPNFLKPEFNEDPLWNDCAEYISDCRINMNVRQVRIHK